MGQSHRRRQDQNRMTCLRPHGPKAMRSNPGDRCARKMGGKIMGLMVREAADSTPAESGLMYPGLTFIAGGIGLKSLSAAGYEEAIGRVIPAAEYLAARGARAVM